MTTTEWTDHRVETMVGNLLRVGVILSALIILAGGVVFLAHPNNLRRSELDTEREISRLVSLGLDGIEARYNRHTPEETQRYLDLAKRAGILTSGGSDFHGPTVKKDVLLGQVEGDKPAPYELLEAMRALKSRRNYTS